MRPPAMHQALTCSGSSITLIDHFLGGELTTRFVLKVLTVAMIGGGLLYFILPADLIPDFIPLVGYLDDLAVLTTIMNSLKGEITAYHSWKETGIKGLFKERN